MKYYRKRQPTAAKVAAIVKAVVIYTAGAVLMTAWLFEEV